ncbi:MAG: M20/M25/M40 family metallo-hydrolase [Bacteroidota bacterium]
MVARFALFGLVLTLLPAATLSAQGLSEEEARIVAFVDAHLEEAIDLLEASVNINSGTLNPEGVYAAGEHIRPHFEALGLTTRWATVPDSLERAGHLVAERTGSQGQRLLLIGHLDTVFEPDSPFQTYARDGDRATGPGVSDMKGGNIVLLYALKALHAVGALEGTTITAVLTGDEERPGRPISVSRAALIEAAQRSDVALGFEGSARAGGQEYATIARRSSSGWTLQVTGRQNHSSGVFSARAGYGAIYELARILNAFREELVGEPYLTFNPGVVLGGTTLSYDAATSQGAAYGKTNVIAPTALAVGDIRTITNQQLDETRARMEAIVERHLPGTSAEITFTDGYPSMPPTEGNRALMEVLSGINRDLGRTSMQAFDPGHRGAADSSFVAPYVKAGLAGVGVYGAGAHGPHESIDLASLPVVMKRAALLVYRLTRPGADPLSTD